MSARAEPAAPNVLFAVWRLSRRVGALLDEALADTPLSASEFGLYSWLAGSGPTSPGELSQILGTPPSTVSQTIRRMEDRGHTRRLANPDDARSALIELTDAGRDAQQAAAVPFAEVRKEVDAALGEDAPRVLDSLHRLERAACHLLGVPAPEPPPRVSAPEPRSLTGEEQRELDRFADWLRWRGESSA